MTEEEKQEQEELTPEEQDDFYNNPPDEEEQEKQEPEPEQEDKQESEEPEETDESEEPEETDEPEETKGKPDASYAAKRYKEERDSLKEKLRDIETQMQDYRSQVEKFNESQGKPPDVVDPDLVPEIDDDDFISGKTFKEVTTKLNKQLKDNISEFNKIKEAEIEKQKEIQFAEKRRFAEADRRGKEKYADYETVVNNQTFSLLGQNDLAQIRSASKPEELAYSLIRKKLMSFIQKKPGGTKPVSLAGVQSEGTHSSFNIDSISDEQYLKLTDKQREEIIKKHG